MSSKPTTTKADVAARSALALDLFKNHFPTYRTQRGVLDIHGLARDMDLSHETIYRAIRQTTEIKRKIAERIVRFSHEDSRAVPLHYRDLLPFIFHDWNDWNAEDAAPRGGAGREDVDDLLS